MGQLEIFCAGVDVNVLPSKPLRNILVNTPNEGSSIKAVSSVLQLFQYAQCEHTFLDSGGFQIIVSEEAGKAITFDGTQKLEMSNRKINIAPEHIINAAEHMQPEIVSALDFPVRKFIDKNEQEKEFMRKFGYNVTWARKTAKLRKERCPQIKLLIPVQAYNVEQFNEFFYSIKDVGFNGFSLPVRNFEAHEIALFLIAFHKLDIPMVHILGTSKLLNTALGAYMARHYFEWVSLDATSWRQSAEHSIYLNPFSLKIVNLSSNVIIDEDIKIDCQCPWCKGKTFTYIKNLPYADKSAFLKSHNWLVNDRAAKELYEHCDTVLTLQQHLLTRCPDTEDIEKLCSVLSIIDAMRDRKIEEILSVCRLNSTATAI